jgi:hypothetical protein
MSFYFHPDGSVNYRRMTAVTAVMISLYLKSFVFGVAKCQDCGIDALQPDSYVLYYKIKNRKIILGLRDMLVAINNPEDPSEV